MRRTKTSLNSTSRDLTRSDKKAVLQEREGVQRQTNNYATDGSFPAKLRVS